MKLAESYARLKKRRPGIEAAEAEIALLQAIADVVVDGRVRAGLSQTELARLANTTQARISALERAEGNPTVDTITRVAVALASSIDWDTLTGLLKSASVTLSGGQPVVTPENPSTLVSEVSPPRATATTAASLGVAFGEVAGWALEDVTSEDLLETPGSALALAA